MAEMTEGFNYGKLDQAVSLAALFIKHQINFLFGKDPKTRTEALGQNLAVLEEKSFRQIVEHLRAKIPFPCGRLYRPRRNIQPPGR